MQKMRCLLHCAVDIVIAARNAGRKTRRHALC